MNSTTTIILGGGFGGIAAANTLRLALPEAHKIVVIDKTARFNVGAGQTWMMLGERTIEQISESRHNLLESGVRFVEAEVTGLDLSRKSVSTDREQLQWDFLVIALGAELNAAKVPGMAESSETFYTVEGAKRLKEQLEQFSGGELVILIPQVPFKCPPAPYEAAMLLHHTLEQRGLAGKFHLSIYTAEPMPMPTAGPEMGTYIKGELAQRSIAYHTQMNTLRVDGSAKRIYFGDGSDAPYDLLITIPPHESPRVIRDAQPTNQSGWIPVDPRTLHVQLPANARGVYAVGDITVLPLPGRFKPEVGLSLPKAGVFAESEGRIAAHHIAATIMGTAPTEIFDGKGFCYMETGGNRAVRAEGSFFELPHPLMTKKMPDEAQYQDKLEWVKGLLRPVR